MEIKCLKCGEPGDFVMMRTILPEDRDKLYSMDVFNYTCPKCGYKTNMEYDTAYFDEDKKEIVIFGGSPLINQITDEYLVRIVQTENQLVEKVHIFEQERDDRIIELMKIIITATLMGERKEPDFAVIYDVYEGNEQFAIVKESGEVVMLKWDEDLYQGLLENYLDVLPPIRNRDHLVVDGKWAVDMMSM